MIDDGFVVVGIDPGVRTGFAEWLTATHSLRRVETYSILDAIEEVRYLRPDLVIFEDARRRKYFSKMDEREQESGSGVREGVGSVKRDCGIWEEFLVKAALPFWAKAPAARATKWTPEYFERVSRWTGRTSSHARDAGALVIGLNSTQVRMAIVASSFPKARKARRARNG